MGAIIVEPRNLDSVRSIHRFFSVITPRTLGYHSTSMYCRTLTVIEPENLAITGLCTSSVYQTLPFFIEPKNFWAVRTYCYYVYGLANSTKAGTIVYINPRHTQTCARAIMREVVIKMIMYGHLDDALCYFRLFLASALCSPGQAFW